MRESIQAFLFFSFIAFIIGFFGASFVSSYYECRSFFSAPYCITHLNTWVPIRTEKK